jgi:hypothetical protein
MPRHKLTDDERRRGQSKGAETKRARREDAEREASEDLAGAVDQAVATLVAELHAENAIDRIRAAAQILDRAWGGVSLREQRPADRAALGRAPPSACSPATWPPFDYVAISRDGHFFRGNSPRRGSRDPPGVGLPHPMSAVVAGASGRGLRQGA